MMDNPFNNSQLNIELDLSGGVVKAVENVLQKAALGDELLVLMRAYIYDTRGVAVWHEFKGLSTVRDRERKILFESPSITACIEYALKLPRMGQVDYGSLR
jgi:hypothetical protein